MRASTHLTQKNKSTPLFARIKMYSWQVVISLLIAFTAALGTTLIVRAVANITATMTDVIIDDGIPLGDGADGKADPGETIEYTTVITNSGTAATGVTFNDVIDSNTTLVGGSINVSPLAINDSFDTIGNTLLDVSNVTPAGPVVHVAGSLFDNDVEFLGETFDSTHTHITSHVGPSNGTLTLDNNTGTFTYLPNANFTGSDSFTYTLTDDGGLTDTATVNINVVNRIWYVKNDVAGAGTGRSNDPFKALASAQTASSAGDTIYVFLGNGTTSSQNAGFTFKNGQRLLGEAVDLSIAIPSGSFNGVSAPTTVTLKTGVPANKSKIGNAAGDGVTLSTVDIGGNFSGVEIRGLDISSAGAGTNAIDVTTHSTFSGSFELADNVISAAVAEGIDVNGGGSGILTVSLHDNTVTAAGNGIDILRGAAAGSVNVVAFEDNIVTGDTGGIGMNVVGTGGTILFDLNPSTAAYDAISGGATVIGASGNGTGGAGMVLTNIKGDLSFTDLDIYTDSGAALSVSGVSSNFVASGTGTRVTANTNTPTFVAASGPALSTNQTNINIIPTTFSSANSATNGVSLVETSGTLNAPSSSSISNASGVDFAVDGNLVATATVSVTYAGTITDDQGTLVDIEDVTGGSSSTTYDFTGAISDGNDGDGSGISLTNNDSATIRFSGGLLLSTATNPAFTATGGAAAVEVCDDNPCNSGTGALVNTLTTTTATALNVSNTTIGANNLEFKSISSIGGSDNGIILDTTGSSGGLKVVGDGTNTTVGGNNSGGTIANKSGSNGSATQGTGVYLNNTSNVVLRRMTISGTNQNFGIRGINSSNITLEYVTVTGTNGTDLGTDEGSVNFDNLTGSAAITSSVIEGGFEDNLNIVNTSGTLDELTITGTTFGFNNTTNGNNNILIESQNTGTTLNFTIQSSIIKGARADWINASNNSSSTMNAVISGNAFDNLSTNAHPGPAAGGNRVVFGSVGTSTIDINNNTMKGSYGEAIRVRSTASGTFTGTVDARVRNNIIGVAGTPNSGSRESYGVFAFVDGGGDLDIAITNNQVFQYNNHGIILQDGDEINDGSVFNATVTGNTVNSPGNLNSDFNGIHLNNGTVGATDNFTSCIDIGGAGALANNIVGSGNGAVSPNNQQFRLRQRQSTTVRLPGYGGTNNNDAAVIAYIQGRNTVTGGNGASSNTVPTGGGFTGGASCTQPSFAFIPSSDQTLAQVQPETNPIVSTEAESFTSVNASVAAFVPVSLSKQASESNSHAALISTSTIAGGGGKPLFSFAQPAPAQSGETIGPISIGNLPAGKSVTIVYQVTVDDPIDNPVGASQISNQGTVTYDTAQTTLTDDPSVGGASDPTITLIDRPDTIVAFINRQSPLGALTNADSVTWRVTFDAPITNLTASNFSLATTGTVTTGSIGTPTAVDISDPTTGSPYTTWDITVSSIAGDGTLGLNMDDDTGLSHDITNLTFTGETYTIDNTAPTVTSFTRNNPSNQITNADSLVFEVTFSEPIMGFGTADFMVHDNTPLVTTSATPTSVSSGPFRVTISGGDLAGFDGDVSLDFSPSMLITDLAGNALANSEPGIDETYTVDNTAPTVTINQKTTAPAQDDPTNASPINFTVVFSEDVTDFDDAADVTLSGTAGATTVNITGGPATYNVAVSGMTDGGTVIASIPASVAVDQASYPNDASTSTDHTVTYILPADLSITKTDGVTSAVPGEDVTYTITASNAGPNDDPAAIVTDTFPASLTATWTCIGANGGTCAASGSDDINDTVNLPVGGSVTYTVNATISASATGSLSNTATVSSSIADTDTSNNDATDTDTLTPEADVFITKTDGVTTAAPGGSVTYTITASNAGPSDAPGSTVADTLPASLTATWTCEGADGGTCETASGSGDINDTVDLPVGGSVTYIVSAIIDTSATGSLSNTATVTVSGSITELNTVNSSATDTDTLAPQADLSITKTDGVTTVGPGGSLTYTIVASNAGPSDAPNTTVTDTFPADLTGISWGCIDSGGASCSNSGLGDISDTVDLPAGGYVTYTVYATLSGAATGTLSNTATVSSAVDDPDGSNNSDTDEDIIVPPVAVTINQAAGQSDPTNASPINFTVVFGSAVTDFDDASDVDINGGSAGATTVVITGGPTTYNVAVSGMTNHGTVVATIPAGVAIGSQTEPNADSTSTDNTVMYDATAPNTHFNTTPANPANSTSAAFTFHGIDGVGVGGLTFECKLDSGSFATCTSPVNYTGLGQGSHTFEVRATDSLNNTDATPASYTWTVDTVAPSVTINQAASQADPTKLNPIEFTVVFNEAVTDFDDLSDVTLSGTASATLTGISGSGANYTVQVTATSEGTVIANIPAGVAVDVSSLPNDASTSTDNTVTYDTTDPTVTINQKTAAPAQADPTNGVPINFTVVFSEAVTDFDDPADVNLSASTTPGTLSAVISGGPTTYNVAVSGMTGDGNVIATVPINSAQDLATNNSAASSSTDNTVSYIYAAPPVITEGTEVTVLISEDNNPIPFALTLNATDNNSDPLTWSISTPAGFGNASADPGPSNSSVISYTPQPNFTGDDSFVVEVTDGSSTDTIIVNVTVQPVDGDKLIYEESYRIKYDTWFGAENVDAIGGGYRQATSGSFIFKANRSFTKITWLTYRGPDRGKAQILVDGAVWKTIDLYSATPQWQYPVVINGLPFSKHTIVIKPLNTKRSISTGKWVSVDAFKIGTRTYDDISITTNDMYTYGSWTGKTSTHAYLEGYRISTKKKATITFSFDGAGFIWTTARGPAYGKAAIYVDGVLIQTVDLYNASQQWQHQITISGLTYGNHTAIIKVLGTKRPASSGTGVVSDLIDIQ